MSRIGSRTCASAALACAVACGGSRTPLPHNVGFATLAPPTPLPGSAILLHRDPTPEGVDARVLFAVPEGSIGPFLARRGDVVMGGYVGMSTDGARQVVSVPLTASGDTRGDAKAVATIATDATMLAVRPTGGAHAGFVMAWTSLSDRGVVLSALGVGDDGRARGAPMELARTSDDIVWLDAVPTSAGALLLWAEQTRGGDANLLAATLAPDGSVRGVPARIARNVKGWQAVAAGDGVGLALVSTVAAKKSAVQWVRFDAAAHPVGSPVTVVASARITGEVDAVRVGDATVLAWTDASQPDRQPVLAVVDGAGRVRGPTRAVEGGAGGTVVGLAAGKLGAALAWEEPFRRGRASRRVSLARVDVARAAVDPGTLLPLDLQGRGPPELAGLDDGFALLAPARACDRPDACADDHVLPTWLRLDARLAVAQVEPFRLGVLREPASSAWSLSCAGAGCLALAVASSADDASRILAVDLRARASPFLPPVAPAPPPGAPLVRSIETLATGRPFADLAAAPYGAGAIVAMVATGGNETRKRDDVATIDTRACDPNGATIGEGSVTKRALSAGGVAVATTGRAEDGAAIAWVARDAGDPQVHVTRIDPQGKLLRDVQITSARGDASDVAIAWGGEQWVVAWVDARDGNGEIYATTLERDGRGPGRGRRITRASGDASGTALLATPGGVWLAWADPRESPQDGFADIYVTRLRARDAAPAGEEVRVLATAAHSRSPKLGARGDRVAVGWIEEAPMGADASTSRAYGAMMAWLTPDGHAAAEPVRLPAGGDGFATSIAFDTSQSASLRVVLARAEADMVVLDGMDLAPGREPAAWPLVALDGPPSLDVALGIVGDALFWNDASVDAEGRRIRRATLRWTR